MRAFSYAWSLLSVGHTIRSAIVTNPIGLLHANFTALVFYSNRVIADRSFTLREQIFATFLLLWPWPWPDNLHIRTWPISLWVVFDERKRTSYVKAFESYCCYRHTNRYTDRQTPSKLYTTPLRLRGWSI